MRAARLVELGVATLHEAAGRRHLVRDVRLLVGEPFAGPAVTVGIPAGDNLGIHLALERAEPGAVLCVASAGRGVYGVVGELLLEAARVRGIAGLVIEDGIRDGHELIGPPAVAACGWSPLGTVKRRVRDPVGGDVALGGTLVRSGDWVTCDRDGIVVLGAEAVDAVIRAAEARVSKETEVRQQLSAGISTHEALGLP